MLDHPRTKGGRTVAELEDLALVQYRQYSGDLASTWRERKEAQHRHRHRHRRRGMAETSGGRDDN